MQNRRIFTRHQLVYNLKLINCETEEIIGYLGDITTEGLMVVSSVPMEIHKYYHFIMQLPDKIFGKDYMELFAESKWCRPDIHPKYFDAGFLLLDPPDQERDIDTIIVLITQYGIQGNI